jgi:hypothetical protein
VISTDKLVVSTSPPDYSWGCTAGLQRACSAASTQNDAMAEQLSSDKLRTSRHITRPHAHDGHFSLGQCGGGLWESVRNACAVRQRIHKPNTRSAILWTPGGRKSKRTAVIAWPLRHEPLLYHALQRNAATTPAKEGRCGCPL